MEDDGYFWTNQNEFVQLDPDNGILFLNLPLVILLRGNSFYELGREKEKDIHTKFWGEHILPSKNSKKGHILVGESTSGKFNPNKKFSEKDYQLNYARGERLKQVAKDNFIIRLNDYWNEIKDDGAFPLEKAFHRNYLDSIIR